MLCVSRRTTKKEQSELNTPSWYVSAAVAAAVCSVCTYFPVLFFIQFVRSLACSFPYSNSIEIDSKTAEQNISFPPSSPPLLLWTMLMIRSKFNRLCNQQKDIFKCVEKAVGRCYPVFFRDYKFISQRMDDFAFQPDDEGFILRSTKITSRQCNWHLIVTRR